MAHGRPNLVRADTIDLQDQDAPTAADHHKHPESDGIAPHQAAQFQHVQEERRSEEETLADAWNMAGQHGNEQGANGQTDGEAEKKKTEGTDAANGEAEDGSDDEDDDDMMDRMSSSPSIEDGALIRSSLESATRTPSPGRGTTQHASYERATFNQSPTPTLDSSPFAEVPRHLPLRLGIPRSQSNAVLQFPAVDSLSPSVHTPETSPLITTAVFAEFLSAASEHHRLHGRYEPGPECGLRSTRLLEDEGFCEDENKSTKGTAGLFEHNIRDEVEPQGTLRTQLPIRGNAFAQQRADHTASENHHGPNSEATTDVSQAFSPYDDQMNPRLSLASIDDQWESDSSEELTKQDIKDDDADAFLNLDDRFIDSGWGGECLRETEDIDFEFVYALHTFVATVEGQANATKGDTMVLLDDSNSYWWLVRVVKDSSIGKPDTQGTSERRLTRLHQAIYPLSTLKHQPSVWHD